MDILKWFATASVVVITAVACHGKKDPKPTATPPTVVDVVVASTQPISNTVELNGSVVANEYVELHPEVGGRLTYLDVPEGKRIEKGTLIARVNDADLKAQLAKTKVLLDLAQLTEQRNRKLLDINGINQADYDAALNVVNGYKADLLYTQTLIDKTVVKAPFSGVVGLRQVSLGAFVSTTTLIATMQQIDKLKIDFNVPEIYSSMIQRGKQVNVILDDGNGKQQKASIVAIEPQANASTRNLKVRAILENAKANPGGFAKVYLDAGDDKKGIMIPTNCLIANDKSNQAIIIKNGKAKFVDVKTGVREANLVEVTKGINVGDSVIVTGVLFARPNSNAKIRAVKSLKDLTTQ
ncbi:efflux RND transporter periplasmic adaptor subunit [Parasediminibacterium sp. JCM 36343]|uniref:efflux RND transporter periplasmic adaptor subunit n=1 Tax=Parasediminibacterium sp. JCM 36343 TaxID=3374279 RepID=UPI00397A17AD